MLLLPLRNLRAYFFEKKNEPTTKRGFTMEQKKMIEALGKKENVIQYESLFST